MGSPDDLDGRKRGNAVRSSLRIPLIACVIGSTLLPFLLGGAFTMMRRGSGAKDSGGVERDGEWQGVREGSVAADTGLCKSGTRACDRFDVVLVLGGGPQGKNGELPEWTRRRCAAAIEIARCCGLLGGVSGTNSSANAKSYWNTGTGLLFMTTSAGSAHAPSVISPDGFPVTEAAAAAAFLVKAGIPPARIMQESAAWDTIGNAWWVCHLAQAPRTGTACAEPPPHPPPPLVLSGHASLTPYILPSGLRGSCTPSRARCAVSLSSLPTSTWPGPRFTPAPVRLNARRR